MISKAKKILITTESHEVFIVRMNGRSNIRGFCPQCSIEVNLLTLDEAVGVTGRTTLELIRGIETEAIHSIETGSGHLLVCRNSLKDVLHGEKQ